MLKETVTRVFRDSGCGALGSDAGQTGESFCGFEAAASAFGVSDGTQKDGRFGLEA